ncbi:MAG: YVTN family beta-propeller protein [Sediminicola sp.]|jgi:YVTN family beta-propeller protein
MNTLKKLAYLFISIVILSACSSDDDTIAPVLPLGDYENGILVSNEGPFGTGTGTISFISEDFSNVEQSIFNGVNNSDLGNIVQSIGFYGDLAYIVANNSNLIKVVNRYTFNEVGTISIGLDNPRFFVAIGDTGYVTNWGDTAVNTDDYVAVIDLLTNTVSAAIPVALGPEKIVANGNTIYVAHQGAYGQNNLVSVISATGNNVVKEITVGDVPNSLVISESNLFVLCGGNPSFTGVETGGSFVTISLSSNEVSRTLSFGATDHPSLLSLDGANMYFGLNGGVYQMGTSDSSLPETAIISGFFYGMRAYDGLLYATDAGDFASDGTLKVFDLMSNLEIQTLEVGIIPGGIYFND